MISSTYLRLEWMYTTTPLRTMVDLKVRAGVSDATERTCVSS